MPALRELRREKLEAVCRVEIRNEEIEAFRLASLAEDALRDGVLRELEILLLELWRALGRRDAAVGADADVILAADVDRVLDVSDHVDRHRLALAHEIRPEHDAGYAPGLRH